MTQGGFAGWVLGNRRVYWTQRIDFMAWEISVKRSDGSVVSTLIADVELMQTRLSPIELAQRAFANPLDRIAVSIIAQREAGSDHAIRSFLGAAFHPRRHRNTMASWRGITVPEAPERMRPELVRSVESVEKPEPLAPPNPDLPFYRMGR